MFDVTHFLAVLALIVVLARIFGAAARRLGQPPVIGEIVAGIALGPSLFGQSFTESLFPLELRPTFSAVADVGLVLFMFIIGYELDTKLIRGREKVAASVSIGSIVLPMVGGFLLGLWLATRHDHEGGAVAFSLFVGAAMSVTAFPVLARILTDRGMHRTRLGGLTIAAAAVDDITAWSLLAVVVTVAGSHGDEQWHVLLSPAYLLVMVLLIRPLMTYVNTRFRAAARLTPDLLAIVLALLLASSAATEWLGVHFIFGAFIMGAVMPRKDGDELRHTILERLEQLSVLLLLPVFFVVAGIKVDLRTIDVAAFVELLAILAVAIGGKFVGAYLGARASGISGRPAGALAALMNTRGLTEIVILTVGVEIGVLDDSLFSLMVVMALVTTVMTGPLLSVIYPKRLVERDIADADRAALAGDSRYTVFAVATKDEHPERVVDVALAIAAARGSARVVVARVLPQQRQARLEVGTGMGSDLLAMTANMTELHDLAARASAFPGVEATVHSQFGDDPAEDLARQIRAADPDLVVLPSGTALPADERLPRRVAVGAVPDGAPAAVAVRAAAGAHGATALQVATHLAASHGVPLHLVGGARRERGLAADLAGRGVDVVLDAGVPTGALVVGVEGDVAAQLAARARPDDTADDLSDWVPLLRGAHSPDTVRPGGARRPVDATERPS